MRVILILAAAIGAAASGASVPAERGRFAPSHASYGPGRVRGSTLARTDDCAVCHADVAAQWRTSAHSFASFNNPIYRVSVEGFREESGRRRSRHCGGCHDPALLVDGVMDGEVAPADPRAHAGVGCRTCHGIEHATLDGNGSYALTSREIPIPEPDDAASVARHVARVAMPQLRTAELCGSCHRAFLGAMTGNERHLAGADDVTPWQRSGNAGSKLARIDDPGAERECRTCHMPLEDATMGDLAATDGKVSSHRFLGGHTWLAAMRGDADGLARAREMLVGAASIDVLPADGASIEAGERVLLDVVVRNLRVGHRFPGGTQDAQDTWISLEVQDADGRTLARAGADHAATGDDPTAHRLRALVVGEDGQPLLAREAHLFRAVAFNQTIAPRDAAVVQYAFEAPARLRSPLRVTAKLLHRSRGLPLQRAACDDSRGARGRAFGRAADSRTGSSLDPCAPQPVTEVARAEVEIGDGARRASVRPDWKRFYEHGLALLGGVQERLDEARPSLDRALAGAETGRDRAIVMVALGRLAARTGRTSEAISWADRAGSLVPGHPALDRLRGDAYAAVWRWREAVPPLRAAARTAPRDDSVWAALAIALGSASDFPGSLQAALSGLRRAPRDPDLLRAQALALREQGRAAVARTAWDASLRYRTADDAHDLAARCADEVPGCALERQPVHVHEMTP